MKTYSIIVKDDRDRLVFRTSAIPHTMFLDALGAFKRLQAPGLFVVSVEEREEIVRRRLDVDCAVEVKDVTAEWHKFLRSAEEMFRPAPLTPGVDFAEHTDAEHLGAWKV